MSTRSESQALLDNAIDVLEALKSTPEDAPFERVIQLGLLAGEIERLGHKDIADMLTVLALAVAPVDDHADAPERLAEARDAPHRDGADEAPRSPRLAHGTS